MRRIVMVGVLLFGGAFASHYTGSYYLGDVTLVVRHDASGYLYGELSDGTDVYIVEGEAYGATPGQGYIYNAAEAYAFESQLGVNDAVLTLTVVELDAGGEPVWSTLREITLQRGTSARQAAPDNGVNVFAPGRAPAATTPEVAAPNADPPGADLSNIDPPGAGAGNPFANPSRPSDNPLAAAAPTDERFAGVFVGGDPVSGDLQIGLEPTPSGYSGQIRFGDQTFTLSARAVGDTLSGTFNSGGGEFAFTATLGDGVLIFQTGDARYTLRPEAAAPEMPGDQTPGDQTPGDQTPKDQQKLPSNP